VVTLRLRFVAGGLACLAVAGHATTLQGEARRAQDPSPVVISVGITPFRDESGAGVPGLGPGVAQLVRQRLLSQHRDTLPKQLAAAGTADEPATIELLQVLGRQHAVKYVVQGGVLPVEIASSADGRILTVSLYADVVALESGQTRTLRVDATAPAPEQGLGIPDPASADAASAAFRESPVGRALGDAVGRLSEGIYQVVSGTAMTTAQATPGDPAAAEQTAASPEEADVELQQLVADAQDAIANYGGAAPALADQVRNGLEQLNTALTQKVDELARGQDTQATDRTIAEMKGSLRTSVDALVQAQVEGQEALPAGESGAPSEGVMSRVNTFASDLLSLVQKIQELQSLVSGAEDEAAAAGDPQGAGYAPEDPSMGTQPVEQAPGSVTGVVVQDGDPVGGAEVTETSTGVTTSTDSDGSYTLAPLPPGLLGALSVKRRGVLVAKGQVPVSPGRASLADFQLQKSGVTGTRLGVLGSTAMPRIKTPKAGTLKGRVLDVRGNPVTLALVSMPGVGIVRTNTRGEFLMSGAPAGIHALSARHTSRGAASLQVTVVAGRTSSIAIVRLLPAAHARPAAAAAPRLVALDSTGGRVHGRIRDQHGTDLPGVRVSLLRGGSTLSVLTDRSGRFNLRNVSPGACRAVIARPGFATETRNITLKPKGEEKIELTLKQVTALVDAMRKVEPARRSTAATTARPSAAPPAPVTSGKAKPAAEPATAKPVATSPARPATSTTARVVRGQLRGRVMDAQTRRPIAGATVSVAQAGTATTDRNGGFHFDGVMPGSREVSVSRPGYLGQKRTITIESGTTAAVDFSLRAAAQVKR